MQVPLLKLGYVKRNRATLDPMQIDRPRATDVIVWEESGSTDVYEAYNMYTDGANLQPDRYLMRLTSAPAPGETVTIAASALDTFTGVNSGENRMWKKRPQVCGSLCILLLANGLGIQVAVSLSTYQNV